MKTPISIAWPLNTLNEDVPNCIHGQAAVELFMHILHARQMLSEERLWAPRSSNVGAWFWIGFGLVSACFGLAWLLIRSRSRSRSNIRTFIDCKSISCNCTSHVMPAPLGQVETQWLWALLWLAAMHRCRITPRLMLLAYKLAHLRSPSPAGQAGIRGFLYPQDTGNRYRYRYRYRHAPALVSQKSEVWGHLLFLFGIRQAARQIA